MMSIDPDNNKNHREIRGLCYGAWQPLSNERWGMLPNAAKKECYFCIASSNIRTSIPAPCVIRRILLFLLICAFPPHIYLPGMTYYLVHVGLAEWIEHPLLMLEVRGSNPGPSENTTSLPWSPSRCSPRSWAHCQISNLREGGGAG